MRQGTKVSRSRFPNSCDHMHVAGLSLSKPKNTRDWQPQPPNPIHQKSPWAILHQREKPDRSFGLDTIVLPIDAHTTRGRSTSIMSAPTRCTVLRCTATARFVFQLVNRDPYVCIHAHTLNIQGDQRLYLCTLCLSFYLFLDQKGWM